MSRRLALASLGLLSVLTGCTIRTDDSDDDDEEHVNARVQSVIVVGTSVTAKIFETGEYGLTLVPKDAAGAAVLGDGLEVEISITNPPGVFTSTVDDSTCTAAEGGAGLSVGVIIDDSGSMGTNDENLKRKDATIAFIGTLGAPDEVLLADYGPSGSDMRDLVCVNNQGSSCSPPSADGFTTDKALLVASAEKIIASGGTPLYQSCVDMVPLVAGRTGKRQAILLLSDGLPGDTSLRDECHDAARAAAIPVFTVGLGPAAEAEETSDPDAVRVLRELSTETGGAYASANVPEQLTALFSNIGTALTQGKCNSSAIIHEYLELNPSMRIQGEVLVGDSRARGLFEFVTPEQSP
jgi:hypothetical protein